MATAVKTPSAGMTGAVRSLQWTIQDMNGSVEHLGQSHDNLRRAQNIMAWTTAIFGALLLSGLVWIANDIFHLKDQLMETDRRFDGMDVQMTALGTRIDDLNISIEQLGAQLLAGRGAVAPATGPDVSVLSSPNTPESFQTAASAPLETTALDAAAQPVQAQPQQVQTQQVPAQQAQLQVAALAPQPQVPAAPAAEVAPAAPADPAIVNQAIAPSPPAPRDQLTPAELAAPAPVIAAVAPAAAPAAAAPAPAAPAAEAQVAAAPAAAAAAPAAPAANLSDDQLLSFNDDQIDPADELLLLDENGNPQ